MKNVRIVLLREVPGVGDVGDVLTVAIGYARNFLFPQAFARPATSMDAASAANRQQRAQQAAVAAAANRAHLRQRLEATRLNIPAVVNDQGHLYGSVGSRLLATAFTQAGVSVKEEMLKDVKPLTTLGEHVITFSIDGHPVSVRVVITKKPSR